MKVLITGVKGMLGRTIVRKWQEKSTIKLIGVDLDDFDICDSTATNKALQAINPDLVIHCAAFTQVDRCEAESDTAFKVNALGNANIAISCQRIKARLIAISTDYVFDGFGVRPYHEWDMPNPRTVYGASKLAGEIAIKQHCPDHCIIRTAWLYGSGGPSFLHTMARIGQENGQVLKVVSDQRGNPTSADSLVDCLEQLLDYPLAGTVHATCEGEATWYDFAKAIFTQLKFTRQIIPCTTAEFPRPAPRPADSRLDSRVLRLSKLQLLPTWQQALEQFFATYPNL